MSEWSIDILRQSGWDLWVAICALATLVILGQFALTRAWRGPAGVFQSLLAMLAIGGTGLIIAVPLLHSPQVGLLWTFTVLAILSLALYWNLAPRLGTGRTALLLSLRIVALALLVPMLFEPVLRRIHKPTPTRPLVLLVDASGSMSFPDVQNGPTRFQSVWQVLRPQLDKIREHFAASAATFATSFDSLNQVEDLPRRSPDGQATDLAKAVSDSTSHGLRADAAIVLISDGIDNISPDVAATLRALGRPVHTVRVGSEQAEPAALANVTIENIESADDFVVNHESPIRLTVKSTALPNRVVEVKLSEIDEQGKPTGELMSQTLVLEPTLQGQLVELSFKPRAVGVQRLAAWIDPIAGERSTVDNRQEFQALAMDPRIKVLYIEGRVRPEYTQLNRALARDPNVEVASLLRITEDRFAAAGAVDGQTFSEMPASAEQWKQFDVIIIGDLDSSFLTAIQQGAIEQFVIRGGGLLMIGGQNTFGPGGYGGSSLEKALPVFVGDLKAAQERTPFVPLITDDGRNHPAMEGLSDWFSGRSTEQLPPLRGNVVLARAKPAAQVLLVHPQRLAPDGRPQIVLATQRYGEGRSAACSADTTYLWYLPLRGMGQDSPYNRFWGQLVRWLAGEDVRNRSRGAGLEGLLAKNLYQLGESVRVRAMVRDERGDATAYAQVVAKLQPSGSAKATQIPLRPSESRTGMYEAVIPSPEKGEWQLELSASKDGKPLGRQQINFTVIPPAEEMLKLAANPRLLREIASTTGGYHCELAQLPALIDDLIRSGKPGLSPQQQTLPLFNTVRLGLASIGLEPQWSAKYDLPMQGLLVIVLLAAEWGLRRQWQLN